jgi:hypothetical protein
MSSQRIDAAVAALAALKAQKRAATHTPASLGGRCATGYERDQGTRVHAVPTSDALLQNGYCLTRAACGAKPGPRSVGWSLRAGSTVSCPRCIAALAKIGGAQ